MTLEILLLLAVILIPLCAQGIIMLTFNSYKGKENSKGITGAMAAREILDRNGLTFVDVLEVAGTLSDHYDPTNQKVYLSSDIYRGTSISSLSVAAHECGHAIQDKEGYLFLKIRTAIYPVVNFTTSIAYWLIMIGLFAEIFNLLYIGICFSLMGLLFEVITLPVEFNASKRAIKKLDEYNMVNYEEKGGCKSVLFAAALTYVAAAVSSALQILRLILISRSRN